ncbi:hypothetical protein [Peptoniphilus catoniae]|uniref:hypothetical protein n=1 Tax=Peptoniphilus catoniae TaxID=1660341 RepID=UPI0010FDB0D8|nr:hypothetical protein [Peptoniphilus catoniae]
MKEIREATFYVTKDNKIFETLNEAEEYVNRLAIRDDMKRLVARSITKDGYERILKKVFSPDPQMSDLAEFIADTILNNLKQYKEFLERV